MLFAFAYIKCQAKHFSSQWNLLLFFPSVFLSFSVFHSRLDFIDRISWLSALSLYGVRATTIEDQNAFSPALCFVKWNALRTFHLTDGQNTSDKLTSDRRSKRTWLNCVLCIPFILSGSPNESWLHTCDACVITTWILGLRAPLVARNNKKHSRKSAVKQYWAQISLVKNSKWQWPYSFNAQCRLANSKYFSSQTTSCKIQFQ